MATTSSSSAPPCVTSGLAAGSTPASAPSQLTAAAISASVVSRHCDAEAGGSANDAVREGGEDCSAGREAREDCGVVLQSEEVVVEEVDGAATSTDLMGWQVRITVTTKTLKGFKDFIS